jgi:hypothetical protein
MKKRKRKMQTQFDQALKDLPKNTGYDFFSHKTPEDLSWICLHELDLHAEGEYKISLTLRKQYLKFIQKYGTPYHIAEAKRVYAVGLQQTEWCIEE